MAPMNRHDVAEFFGGVLFVLVIVLILALGQVLEWAIEVPV